MKRLIESMRETCRGDTILVAGLDSDDPALAGYPVPVKRSTEPVTGFGSRRPGPVAPPGPVYEVRPGLRQVVAWLNELAVKRTGQYRVLGTIGDDNVPRTDGWDVRLMEALEKTPFAFGNDLYPHRPPGALCCHVFIRSEIVAALGCFGPPVLRHSYVDDAWMAWGRAAGITFLEDVIIEHLHFTTGAPMDESYRQSQDLAGADAAAFAGYRDGGAMAADIAKIMSVL
jgi:hypothetical protein